LTTQFSFLKEYLPLVVSILFMVFAIILQLIWFRKPRQESRIENQFVSYLRNGTIQKDSIVSSLLETDPTFLFPLLTNKLSTIHRDSDTFRRFSDIVFESSLFDHITDLYHQDIVRIPSTSQMKSNANPSKETPIPSMFHCLIRELRDPRSLSFLQSELDQNEIPNEERMELIQSLFSVDVETAWMNAFSVPFQAREFSSFENTYAAYLKDFLSEVPIPPLDIQKIPSDRFDYFKKLLFSEKDEFVVLGIQVLSNLQVPSAEDTVCQRLMQENNTTMILTHCMEGLRLFGNDKAAKILFDYLQNPSVHNSSQLLQKVFTCLQDMKEAGQPYLVLAAHSTIPIVRVMAESFLHTPSR